MHARYIIRIPTPTNVIPTTNVSISFALLTTLINNSPIEPINNASKNAISTNILSNQLSNIWSVPFFFPTPLIAIGMNAIRIITSTGIKYIAFGLISSRIL